MRFRTGVAGAACALVISGVIALPAGAQTKEVVPKLEPTATAGEACELIFGKAAFTKAPSEGEVSPGEPVSIDVTWGSGFAKDSTVEVVGCTAVDNVFKEELSTRIRRVKNDGLFVHEFTIPKDLAKGAKLCERAIVIGQSAAGRPKAEKLDADCFTLASGAAAKTAGPSLEAAPAPSKEVGASKDVAPAKAAAPAAKPTTVAGATETRKVQSAAAKPTAAAAAKPAAAAAPATEPALARTGAGDDMLMVAAGLLLALGGLSVLFSKPLRAVAQQARR